MTKLSDDQRKALQRKPDGPIPVEDNASKKVYVIVGMDLHEQGMKAMKQLEDLTAIREGIDDMEAGRFVTLEDADAEIRKSLGFKTRKKS